jgi:integrase
VGVRAVERESDVVASAAGGRARLAQHRAASDPRTAVPRSDLLPARLHRAVPYLYSDGEIVRLIEAARALAPPLKAATYATLIGLLSVTGMRVGEAIGLDRDDVDLDDGWLLIRHAKNDHRRVVPLHESTVEALAGYARLREHPVECRRDRTSPSPSPSLTFEQPADCRRTAAAGLHDARNPRAAATQPRTGRSAGASAQARPPTHPQTDRRAQQTGRFGCLARSAGHDTTAKAFEGGRR